MEIEKNHPRERGFEILKILEVQEIDDETKEKTRESSSNNRRKENS